MISRSRLVAALGIAACIGFGTLSVPALAATAKPAWSPVTASGPTNLPPLQNEIQRVGVDAEGGAFTLSFGAGGVGVGTTAPIPATASAEAVEGALNALTNVKTGSGTGTVSVVGGPGGKNGDHPYFVTFGGGPLANTDVPLMTASSGALTGGGTHTALVSTVVSGGLGTAELAIFLQNIGGAPNSGPAVEITVTLPPGITTAAAPRSEGSMWNCGSVAANASTFTCTSTTIVEAGITGPALKVPVKTTLNASSTQIVKFDITGGNAAPISNFEMPLSVSATPAEPGIQTFTAGAYDEEGERDDYAGAHPSSAITAIMNNTVRSAKGQVVPAGEYRDINAELPPGFLGNPTATPRCPLSALEPSEGGPGCSLNTIVGVTQPVVLQFAHFELVTKVPVFNIEPPVGSPAEFKFNDAGEVVYVSGSVRSDGDYGVTFSSLNTPQIAPVYGVFFTFWGTPASSSNDALRGGPSTADETALLVNPTDCKREEESSLLSEPPLTTLIANTWQAPEVFHEKSVTLPLIKHCDELEFKGVHLGFQPTGAAKSDSPTAFETNLTMPDEGLLDPGKRITPELKKSVITLPKGVTLNPAAADGLGACTSMEMGQLQPVPPAKEFPAPNRFHFSKESPACPDSSKIGTVEVRSALVEGPLPGTIYLAAQEDNPFKSLFAVYVVIDDPRTGIVVKLPGEVKADPQTGQLKITVDDAPQLPFTSLKVALAGGSRAPLASPQTCGQYATNTEMTPWSAPESGPPTESSNGFEINQGPNGLPCAKTPQERPFDIGWEAGSSSTQAGASGPFSFQITRSDGSQEIDTLSLTTPPGLSASLKGVPYCTEAQIKAAEASTGKQEEANPACPSASQVGRLAVGTGSGPTPFYSDGKLYLAGPYKGAPISVVSIVPAVAGPFDLGNVVSRNALFIDRQSAQVTAKSDPIPQIVAGVVLRIKDIRIFLNHKDWTLNPTSCEPSSVNLEIHGNSGAVANRSNRFQVGGCDKLNFAPKLTTKVTGPTKRGDLPAFTAELTYPEGPGYANIKDVQVTLPHSEFLEQAHINTVCTRVQAAANACPAGSIYGYAEAATPLIDGKLTGPVFLKSSVHKLPDLAIALKGPDSQPVEVEFAGRIDSVHGQIRNTIEGLPDVPVSKFVLRMKGGKKGLLVNSRNLCQGKPGRMTVKMTAQNNKRSESRPLLGNSCGAKRHKKTTKSYKKHHRLAALHLIWPGGGLF